MSPAVKVAPKSTSVIFGLDWLMLIIFGLNVFIPCNRPNVLIEYFFKIIMGTLLLFQLITCFISYVMMKSFQSNSISEFSAFIFDVTPIIFTTAIYLKKNEMVLILQFISNQLDQKLLRRISFVSFLLTIYSLAMCLNLLYFFSCDDFAEEMYLQSRTFGFKFDAKKYPNLMRLALALHTYNLVTRVWIILSPCLYSCVLVSFYFIWRRNLSHLVQSYQMSMDRYLVPVLIEMTRQIKLFESSFSIQPCLWLTLCFICLTAALIDININALGGNNHFVYSDFTILLRLFMVSWTFVGSIVVTCRVKESLMVFRNEIKERLEQFPPSFSTLVNLLKVDSTFNGYEFTVWSIAPINRSLIPSYIASVVAFSVLLVQVQNGSLRGCTE